MKNISIFIASFVTATFSAGAGEPNYLKECISKQAVFAKGHYQVIYYKENMNELYHSAEPWQQYNQASSGAVWYDAHHFVKHDTLMSGKRTYYSKTQLSKDELLWQDYGEKELSDINWSTYYSKLIETARYTPVFLLYYFQSQNITPDKSSTSDEAVYKTSINKAIVSLHIRGSDRLVSKISVLQDDALRGDVLSTYNYSEYNKVTSGMCPLAIRVEKINGRITDEIKIISRSPSDTLPALKKPADYTIKNDQEQKPEISVQKYNEHLYFVDMKHAGTRVLMAEFKDFLFVTGAPLSSNNGELLLAEAKKIAPNKPVKYFAFGHHHPHYVGGMRAFVSKGATVLSVESDQEYLNFLAAAPHTLNPDSQQLHPKPLKLQTLKDSATISDGSYSLKIYFIGEKSKHTKDYLVYYFPQEKLVFEDDLVWIEKQGAVKKASGSQAGLYQALKDLRLDVTTLVQSWGITYDKYKTIIPFEELEASANVK